MSRPRELLPWWIALLGVVLASAPAAALIFIQAGGSGGGGSVLAGETSAPSGTVGYNGGTNYWCDFTVSQTGTVSKGYLYVKAGYSRNVKMFVWYSGACYYSAPVYMDYRTNQWIEFTFSSGPAVTSGQAVKIGFISDYGVDIGQDSGTAYVGYQSDSYASPSCAVGSPSYDWNKKTGWYVTN